MTTFPGSATRAPRFGYSFYKMEGITDVRPWKVCLLPVVCLKAITSAHLAHPAFGHCSVPHPQQSLTPTSLSMAGPSSFLRLSSLPAYTEAAACLWPSFGMLAPI